MKCQSRECSAEARYRYNWPGQGLHFACGPCTARAAAILKILGYELPLQRLEDLVVRIGSQYGATHALGLKHGAAA